MRFSSFCHALLATLLVTATCAYADTMSTFNLSGDFAAAHGTTGTASGTITIDTSTGLVESIDLSFLGEPGNLLTIGTLSDQFAGLTEFTEAWDSTANNSFYSIDVLLPVSTLAGYTGGDICSAADPCLDDGGFAQGITGNQGLGFIDGELIPDTPELSANVLLADPPDPPSPVSEPASILLLATGVLGLAVLTWRRRHGSLTALSE